MTLPPLRFGGGALEHHALLEETEDPAQVARIQPQLPSELGGGGSLAMRELVEHAHLAQRELALEVALLEEADLASVEAIEAPHGGHALVEVALGHGHPSRRVSLSGRYV